ncbi:FHA domain-containing protein [Biformimicrobium ophioploci]|uniref:FHA domain-containing protein n=1 Tax=Biformimicrobium ophioploci TaxID=3036711 RepID=A0ABQ6LYE0_9GAMM|nr:FHA domain-containing protein [Microbulbifer sp. NKW57]GMG87042.1 hypothetical protein MNKW57_13630 [Microbulbifer sp. NKW57]
MASIRNPQTHARVYLMTHHTIGRKTDVVDTCIATPEISGIHAAILWNGDHWSLRDLSRNGTWINKQQLVPARNQELSVGDEIRFGRPGNPAWRVESLEPPTPLLLDEDSGEATPVGNYVMLPDRDEPEAALYFNPASGQWLLESLVHGLAHEPAVIEHGETVRAGGRSWQLFLPDHQRPTQELALNKLDINAFQLQFDVSLNEEHVSLKLVHDQLQADLQRRTHHYLLLHLARCRYQDQQKGLDEQSQGWIAMDVLAQELGLAHNHINIQIFRLRRQIEEAVPDTIDAANLLQRRAGEIRIGCNKILMRKGEEVLETEQV